MSHGAHERKQSFGSRLTPALAILFSPLILGLVVVFAPLMLLDRAMTSWRLKRAFRRRHVREGRFVLFIYSDSPKWREYLAKNLFPQIRDQCVFLNWSERRHWQHGKPLEAQMLGHWGGGRDFNPMAIIVPSHGRVRVVRFHQAFRDFKHGNVVALRAAEEELLDHLRAVAAMINPYAEVL